MSNSGKLIRLFSISPKIAISKVFELIYRKRNYSRLKRKYFNSKTYSEFGNGANQFTIYNSQFTISESRVVSHQSLVFDNMKRDLILKRADEILKHKFELLGSELKKVKLEKENLFNKKHPNFSEQKEINNLLDKEYELIDWQLDFISGYRWNSDTFYKDVKYSDNEGADIKVPWDFGRMQHLHLLAMAYLITNYELRIRNKESDNNHGFKYLKEFQNQVLDFISSNPPGFGVQWASAMDVAIRAVNWIVSYSSIYNSQIKSQQSLVVSQQTKRDASTSLSMTKGFEYYFVRSIYEHGKHIVENPEWSSGMRGNHYLANITGLIFIASFLPETEEINSWLNFAINEFCNEILFQFNEDGSNFEASTNYHYFSSEMVFSAIQILLNLPEEKLLALEKQGYSYYNYALKRYCMHTGLWEIYNTQIKSLQSLVVSQQTKRDATTSLSMTEGDATTSLSMTEGDASTPLSMTGDLPEMKSGEGRIVFSKMILDRLQKIYEFSEAIINEEGTIPQIGDNDSGQLRITNYELEIRNEELGIKNEELEIRNEEFGINNKLSKLDLIKEIIRLLDLSSDEKSIKEFNDFGLYILEKDGINLFIRCGSVGQKEKGGHCHNDQLSFELFLGNKPIIVDPGTYVYTPNPGLRNEYRSTKMHNTLWLEGIEQNDWWTESADDLFWIKKDKSRAKKIEFSDKHFIGEHYGYGKTHRREIGIRNEELGIKNEELGINEPDAGSRKPEVGSRKPEVGIRKPEVDSDESESIIINGKDICELNETKYISFHFAPGVLLKSINNEKVIISVENRKLEMKCRDKNGNCDAEIQKYYYSPGYGLREEAERVIFMSRENLVEWEIEIKKQN